MTGKYYKTKRDIPPTAPSQSNLLFKSADTDYISRKMWIKFVGSKFYREMYKNKCGFETKEVDKDHISVLFQTDYGLRKYTEFINSKVWRQPNKGD